VPRAYSKRLSSAMIALTDQNLLRT